MKHFVFLYFQTFESLMVTQMVHFFELKKDVIWHRVSITYFIILFFKYNCFLYCVCFCGETALGDPLIKGLTEVANNRPKDPVKFLADYLNDISKKVPNNNIKEKLTEKSSSMNTLRVFDSSVQEDIEVETTEKAATSDDRVSLIISTYSDFFFAIK